MLQNHKKIINRLIISMITVPFCLSLSGCHSTQTTRSQSPHIPVKKQQSNERYALKSYQSIHKKQPVIANTELLAKNFHPETVIITSVEPATDVRFAPVKSKVIEVEPEDLITRLRGQFVLDKPVNNRVLAELKFYKRHPEYISRVLNRARPYLHFIAEQAEEKGVPMEMAFLPVVESAFQPFAYSHGRASGLWQFIPGTGKRYGLKQNWWYDGRRDVVASTKAAMSYLSHLSKSFDDDWLLALASYNAGSGNVSKAVRRNKRKGKPTDFWHLSLPKETESYVPKLIAFCMIIENPEKFGISLEEIEDKPYFELVDVESQIDLALVADLAGISLTELYLLNPGFNRWATDPDGPHQLALPIQKARFFSEKLAHYPEQKRIRWVRHKISSGEALLTIAKKYNTTVEMLRRVNQISGNNIRAGHHLIVPVALKSEESYALSAPQRHQNLLETDRKGRKNYYTVRPGDTLWDISRKYNTTVMKLAKWNGMAPGDRLKQGQKLVVWSKSGSGNVKVKLPGSVTRKVIYTVRSGDSLYVIAQRFRVSVSQLRKWNRLSKNSYLQPGQKIRIYVDVTRQSSSA